MPELEHIHRPLAPPARPDAAHKGTFGTVIVVGGSATMIGAPAIAAASAFRSGAGLVKLATPASVLPFALIIEPSATGVLLEGSLEEKLAALDEADPDGRAVLAIGPGIGQAEAVGSFVMALLRGRRRVVLDADGLNLLARTGQPRPAGPTLIMTPHPGEFARLAAPLGIDLSPTDPDSRPAAAAQLAEAHGAVVVLKGQRTVVCDGRRVFLNTTGNAALATAGSGDVLTGVIASLIAQGMEGFDAAVLGVHMHGLAADRWAERHGTAGLTAHDLTAELPDALEQERRGEFGVSGFGFRGSS